MNQINKTMAELVGFLLAAILWSCGYRVRNLFEFTIKVPNWIIEIYILVIYVIAIIIWRVALTETPEKIGWLILLKASHIGSLGVATLGLIATIAYKINRDLLKENYVRSRAIMAVSIILFLFIAGAFIYSIISYSQLIDSILMRWLLIVVILIIVGLILNKVTKVQFKKIKMQLTQHHAKT